MGTFFGDSTIDGERAQKRQQHQDDCRHWSQGASREEGYAWLIAKCRKIINARQTHYFVPGVMAVVVLLALEGSFNLFDVAFQQPALENTGGLLRSRARQRLVGGNQSPNPPAI